MGYQGPNTARIGLHYGGPRAFPVLVALSNTGAANGIAISRDGGLTWALAVSPAPIFTWTGAAWSEPLGYAIAVAFNGTVARSFAPALWTAFPGNLGAGFAWHRPIWTNQNGGRFVVVSDGAGFGAGFHAATSVDGSVWVARATPVAGGTVNYTWLLELPTGRIIAGGQPANVPCIFSDDGGDTWAFLGALPLGRVDGLTNFVALPTGAADVYFPSDFATGAPFSDYLSNTAGAAFTQLGVFPGVGGAVTCCAVSPSGVIVRGDNTGMFRTTVGQLVAPPPVIYGPSLPGVVANAVLFVPGSGFVGLELDGATLRVRRSALGAVGTWSTVLPGLAGDYRRLVALPF